MTPSHILTATSALVACMAIWALVRSFSPRKVGAGRVWVERGWSSRSVRRG